MAPRAGLKIAQLIELLRSKITVVKSLLVTTENLVTSAAALMIICKRRLREKACDFRGVQQTGCPSNDSVAMKQLSRSKSLVMPALT